jgi:hypothetical protein
MPNIQSKTVDSIRWVMTALLTGLVTGCMTQSRGTYDMDRTPIVNTGTRASIIYPNQGAPVMPGTAPQTQHPAPGSSQPPGQAPGTGAAVPPSGAAPGASHTSEAGAPPRPSGQPEGEMTFLGGARTDEQRHVEVREDPLLLKYLTAPVALLAAPFVLAKEAMTDEREPGPPIPRRTDPSIPRSSSVSAPIAQPSDYESAMLQNMERELEQRSESAHDDGNSPSQLASTRTPSLSIAEELAALQRTPELPRTPSQRATATAASNPIESGANADAGNPYPTAHGIVDRNGDGRIDQWIFREDGEIVREVLDEDFDGRPDQTIHFDRETRRPSRVEEDTSGNGAVDSWTDYRQGEIVRRRSDSSGDGIVDTWSFYRNGELTRHEQDTTGDGFRDVISSFEAGRRIQEERDNDGDGQADTVLYFDDGEQLTRQEEDRDGDGNPDVVSHYQSGRLVRREMLDPTEAVR